ncbi:MAG: hypothetical protein F6K41_19070 [Symploca sp. SIO3E6]|nr:hypothetical protein [Caldora sp. SIO3E6]
MLDTLDKQGNPYEKNFFTTIHKNLFLRVPASPRLRVSFKSEGKII